MLVQAQCGYPVQPRPCCGYPVQPGAKSSWDPLILVFASRILAAKISEPGVPLDSSLASKAAAMWQRLGLKPDDSPSLTLCVNSASMSDADLDLRHMSAEELLRRLQVALRETLRTCQVCDRGVAGETAMTDHERGSQHEEVAQRHARRLVMLETPGRHDDSGWCDACG